VGLLKTLVEKEIQANREEMTEQINIDNLIERELCKLDEQIKRITRWPIGHCDIIIPIRNYKPGKADIVKITRRLDK
jgi:hypothetical protein